ncbi:MAG: 30S ribosome-binding factor RbfA [Chitinophagales bacterium]|nr:30S ribosome-binding factor RbfA [Chitinophagales bacterium]
MESIRQKQVAKLIQVVMSDIFREEAHEILEHSLVTVAHVRLTPDLSVARIYLSIYNTGALKPEDILGYITFNNKQIRGILGKKIRNKVRHIPNIEFFLDDTLDEVFKLEELFKEIRDKENKGEA